MASGTLTEAFGVQSGMQLAVSHSGNCWNAQFIQDATGPPHFSSIDSYMPKYGANTVTTKQSKLVFTVYGEHANTQSMPRACEHDQQVWPPVDKGIPVWNPHS